MNTAVITRIYNQALKAGRLESNPATLGFYIWKFESNRDGINQVIRNYRVHGEGMLLRGMGLCASVFLRVDAPCHNIIFRSWPKYSGDCCYPVEGCADLYRSNRETYALLDGEWGALRKELFHYTMQVLIEIMETEDEES